MHAPLHGIRVLEVASWLAAPSCAALMADMGAEVIKVEPPGGDAYRCMYHQLLGEGRTHPNYQFDNRGKRGFCVDLDISEGAGWVRRLVQDVDVCITNLTQDRLERYALTETNKPPERVTA
jgi:crotonobetainyl-CoA:carnitine CoA-transferase CaiB-like acyl-CoA transferase